MLAAASPDRLDRTGPAQRDEPVVAGPSVLDEQEPQPRHCGEVRHPVVFRVDAQAFEVGKRDERLHPGRRDREAAVVDVEVIEALERTEVHHSAISKRAAKPEPIRLAAFGEQPHRDAGAALPRAEHRQLSQQPKSFVCHAVARRELRDPSIAGQRPDHAVARVCPSEVDPSEVPAIGQHRGAVVCDVRHRKRDRLERPQLAEHREAEIGDRRAAQIEPFEARQPHEMSQAVVGDSL